MNHPLFSTFQLGDLQLANRMVMAPMTRIVLTTTTHPPISMPSIIISGPVPD